MNKNEVGKWIVFAYGGPDHASAGLPITGDAANITANIRIDGAAANAVDDTNPTELEDGYYIFDITATESNGDNLLLAPQSSTANVIVIAVPGAVWTRPANFNDLGIEPDGDLTKVNTLDGQTAQTGDTYALANGSAGFVAIDTNVDSILIDTAEIANLNNFNPASDDVAVVTLVNTTTINSDMRGTDSANTIAPDNAGITAIEADTQDIQTQIGTSGAGLTDLGGMSTGMKTEVNAEVVDTLNTDVYAEPGQGAPGGTVSLVQKIGFLYKAWRNKTDQTATTLSLYDDAGTTVDQKSTVADNGTTASRNEIVSGP